MLILPFSLYVLLPICFFFSSFKTFDCKNNEYLLVLYLGFSVFVIVFWVITEIRSICLFAFIFTSILLEETVVFDKGSDNLDWNLIYDQRVFVSNIN